MSDKLTSAPGPDERVGRVDLRTAATSATEGVGWERAALENIALAAIREQRAARRWKIFFRFVVLALIAAVAWSVVGRSRGAAGVAGRHTALVSLNGEIAADADASAAHIDRALRAAFADSNTVGVILRINSPGGSPVQAGIINAEIRRLRNKYPGKPIYTVVDDMCASGGYYVAVATDKIFVDKASIVGSIGVRMDGFGFTGLMSKLGIDRRMQTAGADKGFYDPFTPETDKMRSHAQEMLDDIHGQFIDAVKQGRGKRLSDSPDIFSGLFWTGQKSIQLGLADGLGDTDYVAREVIKASTIVDYSEKENLADRVVRKFGASIGSAAFQAMVSGTAPQMH